MTTKTQLIGWTNGLLLLVVKHILQNGKIFFDFSVEFDSIDYINPDLAVQDRL